MDFFFSKLMRPGYMLIVCHFQQHTGIHVGVIRYVFKL